MPKTALEVEMENVKRILEAANITISEGCVLFMITRQTFYRWVEGYPVRNKLAHDYVIHLSAKIQKATEKQLLPLPEGRRANKIAEIKAILQQL